MTNSLKLLASIIAILPISQFASASHHEQKSQMSKNALIKCENVTGIFLQEWINGERRLNSFIKLKDVKEPLNYTNQVESHLKSNTSLSSIEIGCLKTLEGVGIRYTNDKEKYTIIQIDNDGRILSYPETSSFSINVEKNF